MKIDPTIKTRIVIALIFIVALHSLLKNIFRNADQVTAENEIARYEEAYSKLKRFLPPHGTAGYLTDGEFDPKSFSLAQYALSPVFIIRSNSPQLLVAEIKKPDKIKRFLRNNQLTVVHQASDRIFLFEKNSK
ncbi:MAG: hypothetical protein HZB87_05130 [Desulfatitalea sp.]|nr:hypothetical protein [Desulfatitalea sp.]